jgi:Mg2+ and Co2+ transporter CorA
MDNFTKYWDSICQIYFLTKHYLLLAEELSDDFDTFLQPVKEHRDAFDHVARVYGYKFLQNDIKDIDTYRNENMNKAVGHAYRAFFDTADWLSYICRQKIRQLLTGKTYDEIVSKYPDYPQVKKLLLEAATSIAKIRENKDISDNVNELVKEVNQYKTLLDRLLDAYQAISVIF